MKHPLKAKYPIEAFTGFTREQAILLADHVEAFDFFEEPSAGAFRDFLITGIVESLAFAYGAASANGEEVRTDVQGAPPRDDDVFETPYLLEDALEKLRDLTDEQVLILFGHQIGLHSGRRD